jgi:hypothetical protein
MAALRGSPAPTKKEYPSEEPGSCADHDERREGDAARPCPREDDHLAIRPRGGVGIDRTEGPGDRDDPSGHGADDSERSGGEPPSHRTGW